MAWNPALKRIAKGASFAGLSFVLAVVLFHFILQPFQVAGLSMTPTLEDRDYLLVDRLFFRGAGLERGDLVVFKLDGDSRFMVKRVLGLPGEEVSAHDGVLRVGQTPVSNPVNGHSRIPDFGPVQVPPSSYFLMGDNAVESLDSRAFGSVARSNIYGRSFFRYLPLERSGSLRGGAWR